MKTIIPKCLKKGDTIGLLSISGALEEEHLSALKKAEEFFMSLGYKVKISDNSYKKHNYLAGCDKERVKALHDFFEDDKITAIVATRGGYGCLRILNDIDYNIIAKNPKIFCGYSDITALLWKIYHKTGLITYHAPMACSDFGNDIDEVTLSSFKKVMLGDFEPLKLNNSFVFSGGEDVIKGLLCPMNLATLNSLIGQDFCINNDIVLLLEDVNEPVYKIDRMITQLFTDEKFKKNVKAIVLGDFTGIDNNQWFVAFWQEFYNKYNIPVIDGLKFGHEKRKLTIPFGVNCCFNVNKKCLYL